MPARGAGASRSSSRREEPEPDAAAAPPLSRGRTLPSVRRGPFPAPSTRARLADLSRPHVESFNYMLDAGLAQAVAGVDARGHIELYATVHFRQNRKELICSCAWRIPLSTGDTKDRDYVAGVRSDGHS